MPDPMAEWDRPHRPQAADSDLDGHAIMKELIEHLDEDSEILPTLARAAMRSRLASR